MTAFAGVSSTTEVAPNLGVKIIKVKLDATADDTDTHTVDLTTYGCTNIDGILGFTESTTGSVVITEAPTTSVTSGTLTITVGGSTDNKARTFIIFAY
jgi:hypothetical protein